MFSIFTKEVHLNIIGSPNTQREKDNTQGGLKSGDSVGSTAIASNTKVDPVCGMRLEPWEVDSVGEWKKKEVYFCCAECRQVFFRLPERFET
jgi:YHS domain-containing protein